MIRGEQRQVQAFSVLAVLNHTVTAIMTKMPIFHLASFGFLVGFLVLVGRETFLTKSAKKNLIF